jgi:hypothetical protein
MTDDLVKRLREYAIHMDAWGKEANHDADIVDEAADRIEKLESALREIRQSTTLYGAQTKARKALEGKDDKA